MDFSCKEKFEILEDSCKKKVIAGLVNTIYEEYIEETKPKVILNLLNKMLEEVGDKPITDISKFKIIVADIKKIEGEKFINDNIDVLKMVGIDPVRDLDYNLRNKRKKYILNVLKGLVSQVGYTVENFISTIYIDGEQKKVLKYMVKKCS
jgi:hypothetical protein